LQVFPEIVLIFISSCMQLWFVSVGSKCSNSPILIKKLRAISHPQCDRVSRFAIIYTHYSAATFIRRFFIIEEDQIWFIYYSVAVQLCYVVFCIGFSIVSSSSVWRV